MRTGTGRAAAARRTRGAVLDEVWRELDGVEALSGPQGGPLSRTVKLILDPLVIRPVQNPLCAGPIVTADGAVLLATRVHASADVLRACAEWFTVLKQVRRSLRITEGNPQDMYFQRCYELAVTTGRPDTAVSTATAERTLRELHDDTAGRTTQALKAHVSEPARAREIAKLIDIAWRRRPLAGGSDLAEQVDALLDVAPSGRLGAGGAAADEIFDILLAAHAGTGSGIRLWTAALEYSAAELGLSATAVPQRPQVGSTASTSTLALPLDRSLYERIFTVLQGSSDRADLPTIAELVDAEIARSCSPWAFLDESLRVAATVGTALAIGLVAIGTEDDGGATMAHQLVNGRWQREAYVLQARRLAVRPANAFEVVNPLTALADELRTPWRPYLRRLWVRLHGRDVRDSAIYAAEELWDVLDGVARSVVLDHRMRVKQALGATAGTLDSSESRAS
jgi:hypothetical protein